MYRATGIPRCQMRFSGVFAAAKLGLALTTLGLLMSPMLATASSHGCDNGIAVPGQEADLINDCEELLDAKGTLDPNDVLDWSVNSDIEDWEGITVFGTPKRVTALFIEDKALAGSIPAGLANLGELVTLRLKGDQLTGSIPTELGSLQNLSTLYLFKNQLTGSIPAELGDLDNLVVLIMPNNQLTGPIPAELGNLANLRYLQIQGNQLTGPIPPELGDPDALQTLFLGWNQLTGPIPAELGNVRRVRLECNQLTDRIPPELGNTDALIELHIGGNQLTPPVPVSLSDVTVNTYHPSCGSAWKPRPEHLPGQYVPQTLQVSIRDHLCFVSGLSKGSVGIPGCPGSLIFITPLVALGFAWALGLRHPAGLGALGAVVMSGTSVVAFSNPVAVMVVFLASLSIGAVAWVVAR